MLPRLARSRAGQAFGFKMGVFTCDAAGIDQRERPRVIQPADAIVAVAGHARLVVHQRIASARQRSEQRRLADIGTACEGD